MKNLTPLPKNLIDYDMRAWQARNDRAQPWRPILKKLIAALSNILGV